MVLESVGRQGGREGYTGRRAGPGSQDPQQRPPCPSILCASAAPPGACHEAISGVWHVITKPPARSDPSDVTRHLTSHPQLTLVLPAKPQAGLFPQPPSTSKNEKDSLTHSGQSKRVPNFSPGIPLSQEKERINATDNSMDGLSDDHTKERKPERERQILYHQQVCSRKVCK